MFSENTTPLFNPIFRVLGLILTVMKLLQAEGPGVCDAVQAGILDLYLTKYWAIKFAAQAATTVLRVDQVCFII